MVRAFPSAVRFTGVSFSYNVTYAVFGGLTPPLVSWLEHFNRLGAPHYVAAVTVLGLLATLMAFTTPPMDEDFRKEEAA
jgi:drug/metabolite transporter (DMT)-like permease